MKIQRTIVLVSALLLGLVSTSAFAFAKNENAGNNHVVPVLVSVNAKGKVTDVEPAYKMRPAFKKVIRNMMDKMITQPATNDDGKAVSCQFVVNLAVVAKPTGHGKYQTSLKYLSSKPLPSGSWMWVHKDQHQIALTNQQSNATNNSMYNENPMRRSTIANNQQADIQHMSFNQQYGGSGH